jgi:TPR repeat protein
MINDADYLWLKQKGFDNDQVNSMYYFHRAENSKRLWNTTNKPWNLVNALADYRKAGEAKTALALVNKHFPFKFANGNKKLKSALLTTTGGVKRDLNMLEQAIKFGIQAHELILQDYRPCTLIGACKMLSGDISQGHEWYQKAINLGFESDSYEQEIRSIYMRAKDDDKAKIKKLLVSDGWRYKWLN